MSDTPSPTTRRRARPSHHRRSIRQFFKVLGPGVVTGAADNDPSGVVTYTQVGAFTGFGLLWLMVIATLVLYVLEEMSTRLAIVHKHGLARVMRERLGFKLALVLGAGFAASNAATLAADIAGSAAAAELLTTLPWQLFVLPFTAAVGYLLVRGTYAQVSRFLLLLTPLFLLYVAAGFWARPDWGGVLRAIIAPPVSLSTDYLAAALGLLGATLTPYMFFWQTDEEVEGHRRIADLEDERLDVAAGMVYANVIFSFIILTSAVALHRPDGGQLQLGTVRDAATALKPLLGDLAFALFGLALITSGVISVPVMAAASAYLVSEVAGWRAGLDRPVARARGFYVVMLSTLAIGGAFALLGVNPVDLIFWSQVLNGALLPILFTVLLLVTNDPRIMGRHTNGLASNAVGWATVVATAALAVLTILSLLGRR